MNAMEEKVKIIFNFLFHLEDDAEVLKKREQKRPSACDSVISLR